MAATKTLTGNTILNLGSLKQISIEAPYGTQIKINGLLFQINRGSLTFNDVTIEKLQLEPSCQDRHILITYE